MITLGRKSVMADEVEKICKVIVINKNKSSLSIIPLSNYLRTKKPNILISVQHFANVSALLSNFISGNKTKVIVTERSSINQSLNQINILKKMIIKLLIYFLYPKSQGIITNSFGIKEELSNMIKNKNKQINVIYNPTYDPKIYSNTKEKIYPHKWFENKKIPVIISVGRLSKEKNFELLIKSFYKFREKFNSKLVILGDGPEKKNLNELINNLNLSKDCYLPGFVKNPYDYMKLSSLFILTSHYEGLPNVLIEAQACEIPIISTDCKHGPKEILLDGKAGILVPVNNEKELIKAMIKIFTSPGLKEEFINISKKNLFRFDINESINQYKNIINETNKI